MRKITHILLAILMTGICFSAVWMTQRRQNQIVVENKMRPQDFTKFHGAPPGVAVSNVFLGPFRNLMINFLWLRMDRLQKQGKFFEMVQLADWILRVQPENATVAQYLAWNMAYNITVTQQDYDARRRWIKKALETLHTAMKYNPNDPILYREMGWIYQHKLGDEMDNAAPYYKQKMAEENFRIFGGEHSPDWKALTELPQDWKALYRKTPYFKNICSGREEELVKIFFETGALPENLNISADKKDELTRFVRNQTIRQELLIDPEHAAWVEEKYGKLNWLLPDAFAIYWGSLGLKKIPDERTLHCQRIVSQSLKMMMLSGRIIYDGGKPGENFVRLPNFNVVDSTLEEIRNTAELTQGGIQFSGYHYFLMDVVDLLYLYGQKEKAAKYYKILEEEVPTETKGMNVQQFVLNRMRTQLKTIKNDMLQSMISGIIFQSIFAFANDADEEAHEMLYMAEIFYNEYRKLHNSEEELERLRLPPFKEFKRNVTNKVLKDYPNLSPTLKAKLELQENNAPPVEK